MTVTAFQYIAKIEARVKSEVAAREAAEVALKAKSEQLEMLEAKLKVLSEMGSGGSSFSNSGN